MSLNLRRLTVCTIALLAFSLPVQAAKVARFWLEHTISRQQYGPVLNQAGYRFQIGTEGYIVLAAQPGQVLFSTYPVPAHQGPYVLEADRIVDLGTQAYAIVRVDHIEHRAVPEHVAPRLPDIASQPAQPTFGESRMETADELSMWDVSAWPLSAMIWGEPFSRTKYDWTLGGGEGKRAMSLKARKLGLSMGWGPWMLSLATTMSAQQSSSMLPANLLVSDLRLDNGSGYAISAGYRHTIRLDDNWVALAGAVVQYRDEDYDLLAQVLVSNKPTPVEPEAEDEDAESEGETDGEGETEPDKIYATSSSSASMSELAVVLSGGIAYEADYWGARLEVLMTAYDDTSVSARVTALEKEYVLDGERSHPLSVVIAGWLFVWEDLRLEAQFTAGAETSLRLGAAYQW